jgi:hypothetical protein
LTGTGQPAGGVPAAAAKGRAMERYMCYAALGVAGVMALLSLLDLILGFPFGGSPFMLVDIFLLLASGIVAYLGYNALRDLR